MDTTPTPIIQQKKQKNKRIYIFKEEEAKKYGQEAAILIQHFQYSIDHHKRNGTHFHEGRYWTYSSLQNLVSLYPFWTVDIIRRILKNLKDKNIILTGNFNKNKYDRTTWFAFKDEDKFIQNYNPVDNYIKTPPVIHSYNTPVDNSVDNHKKPVDNPVDIVWIKKTEKNQNSKNKSEEISHSYQRVPSGNRRNVDLGVSPNGFGETPTPIPIYSYLYSSIEEVGFTNNSNGGSLKKYDKRKKEAFAARISKGYILPGSIRRKLHKLGYKDSEIDKEVPNMVRYHEENPQFILNEHSCVMGWFENYRKRKGGDP